MIKTLILSLLIIPFQLMASEPETITLTPKNTVVLNGPVTEDSMSRLKMDILGKYYGLFKPKTIYLVLDTPGGSVMAGDQFIDFANSLDIEIKTIAIFSASMGFHIIQNMGERLVMDSSVLMSHRASLQLSGELYGEFDSRLKYIRSSIDRLDKRIANRMGIHPVYYQKLIRDELWVDGEQALKLKAADKKVKVVCDKSLKGTRVKEVRSMFGTMKVRVHACPLITGALDIDTSNISNKNVARALRLIYTDKERFVKRYISDPDGFTLFETWLR